MMIWILSILCVLLLGGLCFVAYKAYRIASVVMVFEDDLSDAIEVLSNTEQTLNAVVNKPVFFDSPEVKEEYNEAIDTVKIAQFEMNRVVKKFLDRSKQKYYFEIEEEPPEVPQQPMQQPWELSPEVQQMVASSNQPQVVPVNQQQSKPKHVFPLFKGGKR